MPADLWNWLGSELVEIAGGSTFFRSQESAGAKDRVGKVGPPKARFPLPKRNQKSNTGLKTLTRNSGEQRWTQKIGEVS